MNYCGFLEGRNSLRAKTNCICCGGVREIMAWSQRL